MLIKRICYHLKFDANILTILFWGTLYLVAMKMTFFPSYRSYPVSKNKQYLGIYNQTINAKIEKESMIDLHQVSTRKETEEEIKFIIEARSNTMQNVCRSKPRPQQKIKRKAFFIDSKHNLLWCSVFKAASTSWLHKLILLGGNGNATLNKKHIIDVARQLYPIPSKLQFNEALNKPETTSFIIVREPFVRILSAYRDKLERIALPYYNRISRQIVKKYRKKSYLTMPRATRPTFEEFVRYLIDPKNEVNKLDEHWIPYSKFCSPCAIKFKTIAKVETLDRDINYIVNKLGIEKQISGIPTNARRVVENIARDCKKTATLLELYFSRLDAETLEKLIKVYEDDFDLFGYDKTPYYSYVKKKQ